MPRTNRPRRAGRRTSTSAPDAASLSRGAVRRESGPDGDWLVRTMSGAATTKAYRCPGCDQEIRAGVPHLVAWPDDAGSGLTDRRHWHTACWSARGRRGPGTTRSSRGPRY